MKTLQEQIIAKQDELIEFYELLFDGDTTQHIHEAKLKKELSALEQQAAQELLNIPNNSQIRNNPTKDLYEMVYVESEADLPKEEGWYICSGKGQLRKYYWRNGESDIWIISNRIDWYLRPLEAEQKSNNRLQSESSANNLKTAEEILKGEMSENLWTFICSYPVSYKSEEKLVEWIIDAMQEYAAQFKAEKEKPIINLINNIECFAQILGKHCVDNKVSLTSNERHTIYDAFKEYIFQIEAEQEVDLNTPFFGNSGAKVPLTEAIITEEINKASLQHSENPENDIYYTAGYRDAIRDFRQKAEQEKVTDEDIKKEALRRFTSNTGWIDHEKIDGFKRGAKAMRDGLITHNK